MSQTSVRKPALLCGACCITATRGRYYLTITMKTKTNGGRFTTCARCTLKHNYNNSWPWAESNRQTSVFSKEKLTMKLIKSFTRTLTTSTAADVHGLLFSECLSFSAKTLAQARKRSLFCRLPLRALSLTRRTSRSC